MNKNSWFRYFFITVLFMLSLFLGQVGAATQKSSGIRNKSGLNDDDMAISADGISSHPGIFTTKKNSPAIFSTADNDESSKKSKTEKVEPVFHGIRKNPPTSESHGIKDQPGWTTKTNTATPVKERKDEKKPSSTDKSLRAKPTDVEPPAKSEEKKIIQGVTP